MALFCTCHQYNEDWNVSICTTMIIIIIIKDEFIFWMCVYIHSAQSNHAMIFLPFSHSWWEVSGIYCYKMNSRTTFWGDQHWHAAAAAFSRLLIRRLQRAAGLALATGGYRAGPSPRKMLSGISTPAPPQGSVGISHIPRLHLGLLMGPKPIA